MQYPHLGVAQIQCSMAPAGLRPPRNRGQRHTAYPGRKSWSCSEVQAIYCVAVSEAIPRVLPSYEPLLPIFQT
jgi:hypothetical protein